MPPLLIAPRAGNDLKELAKSFDIGVDYAEADVWLYRKRLEVRHDKTAGPIPLLWERWSLKPGWKRRLVLAEVIRAAIGHGRIYLDLKGVEKRLPAMITSELRLAGLTDVAFSSPNWWYLDKLKPDFPDAVLFYTLSNLEWLEKFRPRLEAREISAVAINSEIVTKDVIDELRAAGVKDITTWGIDDREAAQAVFANGVNGVTSGNLELLAEIRRGELS